jgi:hypothetical protein
MSVQMNQDLVKLEQMLKTHDWYYYMSDDQRAYSKGCAERNAITKKMVECEELGLQAEAKVLLEKFAQRT